MTSQPVHKAVALCAAAALLASLAAATTAAPATAKPKCFGKPATIVGTAKGEVIKGTKKADVIVAKGGHDKIFGRGGNDTICGGGGHDKIVGAGGKDLILGGPGRDKLFGGPGRDRLLGGPANDRLAGGPGNDACLQGQGTGLRIGCERPVVVLTPPPTGPFPIPLTGILAVAYSDIDSLDGYSTGDKLIAKLVDTDPGGVPNPGDTIEMGRYPMNFAASAFGDWLDKGHVVVSLPILSATQVAVTATGGGTHTWLSVKTGGSQAEYYHEVSPLSIFQDGLAGGVSDVISATANSPSAPQTPVPQTDLANNADDGFVDVVLNY